MFDFFQHVVDLVQNFMWALLEQKDMQTWYRKRRKIENLQMANLLPKTRQTRDKYSTDLQS
jgi:hypothetical protein